MMKPKPLRPRPDQESVWDYPRPPRLEPAAHRIRAIAGGVTIAESNRALRVLETSHPPTYYLPPEDVRMDLLVAANERSACEWKGLAIYYDAVVGEQTFERVAWSYPDPTKRFLGLKDHLAFYLPALQSGYVGEMEATPQPGGFYGGWITSDLAGPFKGIPGSWGW